MGAKNIEVIGNIKLASLPKTTKILEKPDCTVITAASTHEDEEALILEQYTFLKRPVIIVDKHIFIGNSKKVVAAAKKAIHP